VSGYFPRCSELLAEQVGVGLHKPHLPHIVPQKYFDLYPDLGQISLPPNMKVPRHFPPDAWSPSGELRSYVDMGAAFHEANFSISKPLDVFDIRRVRRGCEYLSPFL
jgi:hypothetical protein